MNGADNSWFSERTKTWIVSTTMAIILVGMIWGYWAAQNWQAERAVQKEFERQVMMLPSPDEELKNDN